VPDRSTVWRGALESKHANSADDGQHDAAAPAKVDRAERRNLIEWPRVDDDGTMFLPTNDQAENYGFIPCRTTRRRTSIVCAPSAMRLYLAGSRLGPCSDRPHRFRYGQKQRRLLAKKFQQPHHQHAPVRALARKQQSIVLRPAMAKPGCTLVTRIAPAGHRIHF